MKGLSVTATLLVIVTLASPAAAGGLPDPAEAEAWAASKWHQARDYARDEFEDQTGNPAPDDGPVADLFERALAATPSNSQPERLIPEDDPEAPDAPEAPEAPEAPSEPPEEPAQIQDAKARVGALAADLDAQKGSAEAQALGALNFIQGIVAASADAVSAIGNGLLRFTTGYTTAATSMVTAAYDHAWAVLNGLPTNNDQGATDFTERDLATQAIDNAVVAPTHGAAVRALVAASGLGMIMIAFAGVRRLLSLGAVAMLSRINSKDIMKNETRAAVHEIVKSDPGVSLNEIVERLGVSRNAVAYHLAVFESEDQIVSVKDGKYRRYFVNGGPFANGAKLVVSALKNGTTRQVVDFIQQHPGVIQKDVCAAIGTSPSATNWHINRLEKVGLVKKEKVANTVQYQPGPSFEKYDMAALGVTA